MSLKLKALGLSVLAIAALSAFAVMNASAEQNASAHFTSDSANGKTIITGVETAAPHDTQFTVVGGGFTPITCFGNKYDGTISANTVQSITITPTYTDCRTSGSGTVNELKTDFNGCTYTFTLGKNATTKTNTVDLVCPAGQSVRMTHPNCEITVPAQNNIKGVAYKTITENGKHTITLEVALQYALQYHAGICVLLGTNKTAEIHGAVTVEGFQDEAGGVEGPRVNITATGPEG